MSKYLETIPLDKIARVQVYINNAKKTVAQIKAETGADYIINGGVYDREKFIAHCHLKADGYTYAEDAYNYMGYGWDTGADIKMQVLPNSGVANYIACVALLYQGRDAYLVYSDDMSGARPRAAIGTKAGSLCLYAGSDALTPEGLKEYLKAQGWTDALMLDSGGSTQCDFGVNKVITSLRRVHNLILVYLKNEEDEPVGDVLTYRKSVSGQQLLSKNFRVREFACQDGSDTILISTKLVKLLQMVRDHFGAPVTINSAYRTKAHNAKVGGSSKSQHMLGTACDIVVKGIRPIDVARYLESIMPQTGGIGLYKSFTHADVRDKRTRWDSTSGKEIAVSGFSDACPYPTPQTTVRLGETGASVRWVQWQLTRHGAALTIDGDFGAKSVAALKAFQSAHGLTADGICGPATRAALQK
jgi:uncharacterized protein YcbK (DUF882 family)